MRNPLAVRHGAHDVLLASVVGTGSEAVGTDVPLGQGSSRVTGIARDARTEPTPTVARTDPSALHPVVLPAWSGGSTG